MEVRPHPAREAPASTDRWLAESSAATRCGTRQSRRATSGSTRPARPGSLSVARRVPARGGEAPRHIGPVSSCPYEVARRLVPATPRSRHAPLPTRRSLCTAPQRSAPRRTTDKCPWVPYWRHVGAPRRRAREGCERGRRERADSPRRNRQRRRFGGTRRWSPARRRVPWRAPLTPARRVTGGWPRARYSRSVVDEGGGSEAGGWAGGWAGGRHLRHHVEKGGHDVSIGRRPIRLRGAARGTLTPVGRHLCARCGHVATGRSAHRVQPRPAQRYVT